MREANLGRKGWGVFVLVIVMFTIASITMTPAQQDAETQARIQQAVSEYVQKNVSTNFEGPFPKLTKLEKVEVEGNIVKLYFSEHLVVQPVRQALVEDLIQRFQSVIQPIMPSAEIKIFAGNRELEKYIPGAFNPPGLLPEKLKVPSKPPLIRNVSAPVPAATAGLYGHYIAVWHSHGMYYDTLDKRWQWQRPRLFTAVEDKLTMSFTIPFLIPMLENAGAIVFCPRERDIQIHEVLVDDGDGKDHPQNGTFETTGSSSWQLGSGAGFKNWLTPLPDDLNPHRQGQHQIVRTVIGAPTAVARWTPVIPESGVYAVYVSYNASPERATDAHYIVNHSGGATEFRVNQQLCGNYWVYLGHFQFKKGYSPENGSVLLLNDSATSGSTVSADCVKFGGGMGNVLREGNRSGYPRYLEGARYWLQYAGVEPSLVYKLGIESDFGGPDYLEDYSSRPEWVNYLSGAPNGPNPDRNFPGLGVPIDVAFAFHTDAGIAEGIVGTLCIYRVLDQLKMETFPDGRSRWLNRDLADLVHSQIVADLTAKYTSSWTKRQILNANYAELRRPNVPSVILELLSHQNFDDMKYALDPRFRFDVSRAIYKAIVRFVAYEYGYKPIIAPLPPQKFLVKTLAPGKAAIRWEPQPDPLEPTAIPEGYILYVRRGVEGAFDNGTYVTHPAQEIEGLEPNEIYSFKVVAVNKGGVSFPTEVLSICTGTGNEPRALIVNAFDRIAPPEFIEAEGYRGVARHIGDKGVGYIWNLSLTGDQYDFNPGHKFLTNDNPGWGASYGDLETQLELGNNFDYVIIHGEAIRSAGWAFDSASDEAVREGLISLNEYKVVDWLLGEERTTMPYPWRKGPGAPDKMQPDFQALPPADQTIIRNYLQQGGRLFISGAYVGTDLVASPLARAEDKDFLEKVLKCQWETNAGSRTNNVIPVAGGIFDKQEIGAFHFSSGLGEAGVYGVELPDSIKPAKDSGAQVVLRYQDAYFNAAIAYPGSDYRLIVFGFPFETIVSREMRHKIMSVILSFLTEK